MVFTTRAAALDPYETVAAPQSGQSKRQKQTLRAETPSPATAHCMPRSVRLNPRAALNEHRFPSPCAASACVAAQYRELLPTPRENPSNCDKSPQKTTETMTVAIRPSGVGGDNAGRPIPIGDCDVFY